MRAVALAIDDVVEKIDDARKRAEDDEGGDRPPGVLGEELVRKDQAGKDEEVLAPLSGPNGDDKRDDHPGELDR